MANENGRVVDLSDPSPDPDPIGRVAAVVRVLCCDGDLSRAIIGYGDSGEEAYDNAVAEARAYCRGHGGTQKITKL